MVIHDKVYDCTSTSPPLPIAPAANPKEKDIFHNLTARQTSTKPN
jgi:hypothetical protein